MGAARKTFGRVRKTRERKAAASRGAKKKNLTQQREKARPAPSPGVPIVGIGASAGGLEAMEEFFRHMSPSSKMAFIVVSHQHAGHVSLLPSLLKRCTAMSVVEATDGMKVEADCVYLAPGGSHLAILHGILHLMEPPSQERVPLPIDYFFCSLAEDQKQRAIGMILSGTGTDGTLGLRAIKDESGMTIAQEPKSAKYQGMPRSAITAGVVDVVQSVDQIPGTLLAYGQTMRRPSQPLSEQDVSQTLHKIFILLRDRTGNDFAAYKENTIYRRIERRMNVHQIQSMKQYLRFVQENQHELDLLFQELLIGVTSFFRDPEAFEALVRKGLRSLVDGKSEGGTLRVWVAGCSTGEEAYSLAILLQEYLTQKKRQLTLQVFASDLDSRAIETARAGLYPAGIAKDLSPVRLQRFFTNEDGSYRIKKEIRNLMVFTTHNVLTDAPFTRIDLLSCRNLLIYLDSTAQQKLLSLFHYALEPNGILFLGSSETIGSSDPFFTVIDRKMKLFKRTSERGEFPRLERFPDGHMKATTVPKADASAHQPRPLSISTIIQKLLVLRYAPAAVVVNARGEVVYIHGHTGAYLEPAPGPPTHHLVEMAREGLRHDLAAALYQADKGNEVMRRGISVEANGHVILVNLTVKKLSEPEVLQGLLLVTFETVQTDKPDVRKAAKAQVAAPLKKGESKLRQELEFMKQRLERMVEDLQTSNEEMKSGNEELQSTNEELQSTNEELETAKEEMQSLNEELVTVNSELQGKLDALAEANDDLQNLLNTTEVATIFLDNELCIKRFTAEAKRVSHLIASDVGRPLSDLTSKLIAERLLEDAQDVLQTFVPKEQEVQTTDGNWFLMRIVPYRTAKNTIEGLVLTFLDITKTKRAEQIVQASRAFAVSIVETVREPLLVLDEQLRVVLANQSFHRVFQLRPRDVEQQLLYHLCNGAWDISELRSLLEEVLPDRMSFQDFIMDQTFPHIGRKVFVLNGRRLEQDKTEPGRILLAMEEVRDTGDGSVVRTSDSK